MKDSVKSMIAYASSLVTAVTGTMISEHVLQVILLCLGIVGAICTLGLNLWRVYDKIKEATKDGQISDEERKGIEDSVKKTLDDLNSSIGEITKEEKKDDENRDNQGRD